MAGPPSAQPSGSHENDRVGLLLLLCRNSAQLFRIFRLLKTSKQIKEQRMYSGIVSLADVDPSHIEIAPERL